MNLLDVVSKAKGTKRKGREFEFADTGAMFEFRALGMEELARFASPANTEDIPQADKIKTFVEQINALLSMDTVVGWRNLTQELFERVAQLERIEGTEPTELIVYEPEKLEVANELIRLMARSSEFAVFVSSSVLIVTNEQKIAVDQKKTT